MFGFRYRPCLLWSVRLDICSTSRVNNRFLYPSHQSPVKEISMNDNYGGNYSIVNVKYSLYVGSNDTKKLTEYHHQLVITIHDIAQKYEE